MGVNGHMRGQSVTLEKVLRNIVKMFMEEKLTYKSMRTLTINRDNSFEVEKLRSARQNRIWGPVEETRAG